MTDRKAGDRAVQRRQLTDRVEGRPAGTTATSVRRTRPRRVGRQLVWGAATAVVAVVTLAGALVALGAVLVIHTLNESALHLCVSIALYGAAPAVALLAAATLLGVRHGRPFSAAALVGALLLVPVGFAVAGVVGNVS